MRQWVWMLSLVLLVGCSSKTPPQPLVSVGKVNVPVVLSTHCWTGGCVDFPAPEDHLQVTNYKPVTLHSEPTDSIFVRFNAAPPKGFTVTHWPNGRPDHLGTFNGRDLNISASGLVPGVHTFSISAGWKQGSATHIFQLEVRQRGGE